MARVLRNTLRPLEKLAHPNKITDLAEAVHQARLVIKRLRALLRLAGSQLPKHQRDREDRWLKGIARTLSRSRDKDVIRDTLKSLASRAGSVMDRAALLHIRGLVTPYDAVYGTRESDARALSRAIHALRGRESTLLKLLTAHAPWKSPRLGWTQTFRASAKGFKKARTRGKSEDFHKWRRPVKFLLYQMEFSRAASRLDDMRGLHRLLDRLQEVLGKAHDLVLVQEALNRLANEDYALAQRGGLHAIIRKQSRKLQNRALRLGKDVHRHKPGPVSKKLFPKPPHSNI